MLEIVLLWVMEPTVDSAVALLDLLLDAMTFTGHEGRRWKGLQDITRLPGLEMLDAKAADIELISASTRHSTFQCHPFITGLVPSPFNATHLSQG